MVQRWLVVACSAVVFFLAVQVGIASSFTDLPPDSWVYERLSHLVDAGLIQEYDHGRVLRSRPRLSRYEVALILGRVHERLDTQQRWLVERQLLTGALTSPDGLEQAFKAMDQSLWEQVFNYVLLDEGHGAVAADTAAEVAVIRRVTAVAADSLEVLTEEFRGEMELLGIYTGVGGQTPFKLTPTKDEFSFGNGLSQKFINWLSSQDIPTDQSDCSILGALGHTRIGTIGSKEAEPNREAIFLSPGLQLLVKPSQKPAWMAPWKLLDKPA